MPAILTDEDIGLDASPSVSLSDEDIGLTEDHKIVRPPKPGTPPPGYLTPEEVFKSQEKTGLFGGLAEGFTAPMKATARGVGLATLSDETLQEHLLGEYWKATAVPEMTGLGKAGQLIGGLAGTVAQAIPVAAGGARIGGPLGAKAAVMAQFGSMGAYDEFIKAGSQALAEGKTPEEATAIGKKAAIAGAGVGAVMGAVAPGAGQGAMDVLKSAAKMGLVGGAGRGIQNVTERALGLSTPVTQDVAKEAAIMALLPAGMGLARFGIGKLFPPPPIEPEVLPAVVPKRPSGGPGAPVEAAPLALPEPTIPDAEIIPPAQLPPPSGTAWPITPPPPRVQPRLTMPIPMGQGEIPSKAPRTLAEVEAMLRTLKEQEPPSEEPPTGEAGVPVGRPPEPPAPISPPAPGSKPTELPSETLVKETPEVAGGEVSKRGLGPEGENAWMAPAIGRYQLLSRKDMQVLVTQDAQYPEMIRATYIKDGEPTGHQLFRSLEDLKQATSNSVKVPQSNNPADMPLEDYVLMRTTLFGDDAASATRNWEHFKNKEKQPTQPKAEYAAEKIIEQEGVQPERERTDALRPTAEAGVSDSLRAATEGKAQEKAPEVLLKDVPSRLKIDFETYDEPTGQWQKQSRNIVVSKSTIPGDKPWRATVFAGPPEDPVAIAHIQLEKPSDLAGKKAIDDLAEQLGRYTRKIEISGQGLKSMGTSLKTEAARPEVGSPIGTGAPKSKSTSEPETGKPFDMTGYRADIVGRTKQRTPSKDLTAKGLFLYGDKFNAERLYIPEGSKREITQHDVHFENPFVFRNFTELYDYTGVSHLDPLKAEKVTKALKAKGHDGYVKLYQSKEGIDEVAKFQKKQTPTQPPSKPAEGGRGEITKAQWDVLNPYEEFPLPSNQTIKFDSVYVSNRGSKSGATHGRTGELKSKKADWIVELRQGGGVVLRQSFGSTKEGGQRKSEAFAKSLKQPTTPPTAGGEGKPAKTLMERYEAGTATQKEIKELQNLKRKTEAETPEVKAETGKRGKTLKEIREAEERRKQEGSFTLQPLEPFVRKAAEHLDKLRAEMGILLRNGKMLEVMTYKKDAANNAAQQYARRIKNGLGKSLFNATRTKYDPFKESRAPTTVRTILMPWEDPHGVQKTALTVGQESFSEAPPNSPEAGVTGLPRLQMQRQKLAAWQPPNEKLGKWKNSLMEGLDYAIANWTRIEPTVRRYDAEMRMQAQAEVNAKVDTLIRSGYVMHAQDVQGLSDFDFLTGRGSGEGASFLKKRYHPTYVDSVMAGVEPRSLDALALAETRIRLGQQKINSRAWTQELRSMTDKTSGNPILTEPNWETRADGKEYPVPPTGDYTIVHMGYQPFAIHKGYETAFKDLTSPSAFTDSLTGRTLLRAAAGTKHIVLAFDTFHLGRLALWSAIYNKGLPAYKKGFVLLDNTVSDLRDMAQRGDIPAEYLNDILENKRKIGLAFKTGYNVTRIQDALWQDWMQKIPGIGPFNKFLFGQFQRGAMMQAWLTEFERQRKAFSWLSESDVARKVSKSLNIRFGNLQSQGVFRSKTMQDVARMLFLAPQWNEGLIRSEIGAAKELGEVGSNAVLRRKFAVGTLLRGIGILFAAQFAANQLINFATRGHSTFENPEEGLDAKMSAYIPDVVGEGPGLFLSPMALPLETTHLIGKKLEKTDDFDEAFRSYARTRLGTLARPLNTWWTGKDVFGKPIREGELWEGILKEAAPVPISGGSAYHAARQVLSGEKAEQFPGQFQRQAMASFGMKTEGAPTAAQQIGALAQKFNKARGQREIPKQFADYAELDRLLRVGNYKDAQKALDELRTKRKDKDIINRFKVKASSGFTHGSKAVEGQFYNQLTEEQKTAYFNARKEQQDLVSRFYKLWAQSPKQP